MKTIIKLHIKAIAAVACVGVFTLATAQSSLAQNLLTDPDFANETAAPNPNPDGVPGWASFGGAAFLTTSVAIGSTNVLYTPDDGGGYSVPGSYQVFAASPGEEFVFSGWVYTPNTLVAGDNDYALLQLTFYTGGPPDNYGGGAGTAVGVEVGDPAGGGGVALPEGTWTYASITNTAPSGTESVGVYILDINADANADFYFDEMSLTVAGTVAPPPAVEPTNNAPTPTNSPALALYNSSGVYTNFPGIDWDASWSEGGEGPFTIPDSTNVVLNYTALQYAGVTLTDAGFTSINTAGYNTLHVNVWTPNANQFGIQLVSLDPNVGSGTQAAQINFSTVSNQWISLNIPLEDFTAVNSTLELTNVQQLLWIDNQGGGVTGGTFFIDNVYFWSNSVVPQPLAVPTNDAATPTANNNVQALYNSSGVYSDTTIDTYDASWSDTSGGNQFTITNTGAMVLEYVDMQYAGWEFLGSGELNVTSDNTLHMDVWTPNANQFGIQLVSLDNSGTQGGQVNFTPASGTIVSNQWVSLDIPLSAFTAAQNAVYASPNNVLDLTALQQLELIDNQGGGGVTGGTFYIDNAYFYASSIASPSLLTATFTSGTVNLAFPTQTGFTYTVQYTTSLTNPVWQTLSSVSGNDYGQTATDSNPTGKARFYRLAITQL